MTELADRIERARADGADPVQRFSLMVESLALYHLHRQELAFVGATEMRSLEQPHRDRVGELRRRIQHLPDVEVDAAHEAGRLRTVNPHHAARAVTYMSVSIARWYRPGDRGRRERLFRTVDREWLSFTAYGSRRPRHGVTAKIGPASGRRRLLSPK